MRKKKFAGVIWVIIVLLVFAGHSSAEEFGWPTPGNTWITQKNVSGHSCNYYYNGQPQGLDIGVSVGTEIFAPASGTVQSLAILTNSDGSYRSYGKYFEIKHDDGTITLYAHLSEFKVSNGQRVNRGDLIALSGNTGNSTGPHLHYEMSGRDIYEYYQINGYRDPRNMDDNQDLSGINPGLISLNSSSYAKVFTLTSGKYDVYTDSSLTTKFDSNYTGYDEEDYITGVGKNSAGVVYAQVQIPLDNGGRKTVYVNLHNVFVPGSETASDTAVNKSGGLYKRKGEGYNSGYWIDPGDTVYLLTKDNGWCQVMYPISGYSYWRIAWLTESDYNYVIGEGYIPPDNGNARDKAVAHAREILNYTWTTDGYVLLYYNLYNPAYKSNGEIDFRYAIPVVAKGTIHGIPYTLSSNGGGGAEKTFEQYKSLSQSDKLALSNIYTYEYGKDTFDGLRVSMKYGMSCATFVTDCIRQGLPGATVQHLTSFHNTSSYSGKVTQGAQNSSGYSQLQKGDYLRNSGHVMLVVENYSDSLKVIEQTPPDIGSGSTIWNITFSNVPGVYCATECNDGRVGTEENEYSYSTLQSRGYYPMYVSYPGTQDPDPEPDGIPIDSAHFPDEKFRECLKQDFDSNSNGYLSDSEIANAKSFQYTDYKGISNLEGIKYLTALEWFYVPDNHIKQLDLSGLKNLRMVCCWNNDMETLTVNDCPALEELWTGRCNSLKNVYAKNNPNMTLLYVDNCPKLNGIYASGSPKLSSINLSGSTSLSTFDRDSGVTVPGNEPTFTTESLPDAYLGKSYSAQVKASAKNTDAPIQYSISAITKGGWIDVFKCSTAGKITGTPQKSENIKIYIRASNYVGTKTKSFTLNIIAKPAITTSELSSNVLYAGKTFTQTIEATSTESVTWSISGGELPPGLSLNTSTGTISGTLTSLASLRKGRGQKDYSFTVRATSKAGYDEKTYKLTVQEPFKITTTSLKNAWKGEDYTAEIYGEGGYIFESAMDFLTWAADKASLPTGLSLTYGRSYNASDKSYVRKAVISGKPTAAGTFSVKVRALDVVGFELSNKTYTLVVKQKPSITTSATLPKATMGRPYSITLGASGTKPITWAKTGGTLPPGMTLSNTGKLSGTPSKSGTYSFTVKASNGKNASRTFTLKVCAKLSISDLLKNGIRKAKYSYYVEVIGGVGPYSWKLTGSVPPGLKFTYSGARATLSGTPTKAGTFSFTLKVTDKNGASVSKTFKLKITQTKVTGTIPATTTRKTKITLTPKATGGASPYTWSAENLPDGLKIDSKTGKITGTATKAGTFKFTVKAKDKNGAAATKKYTVKVTQTAISGTLANATKGSSYNKGPKVSGGASPYIWSISSGKLPNGLKQNTSSGKITGTPTKTGSFTFTVKVKDKNGAAATKKYTVKVTAPATKSALPDPRAQPYGNTSFTPAPSLRVISDDITESHYDRDSDIFTVKAGQPVSFILGGEISDAIIYIDDIPAESVSISDEGTFTLPAEFVSGDFKVQVKSSDGNIESEEAFIISE